MRGSIVDLIILRLKLFFLFCYYYNEIKKTYRMTCKTKVELHSTSRTCVFTNWFNFNPWFDCPRSFTLCVKCGYFYVKPWRSSDFTFGECKTIITICNKISNFIRFSRIYYLLKRWITFLTIFFPLVGLRLSKSESYIVLWEADGIVDCKILHYLRKKKKKNKTKNTH